MKKVLFFAAVLAVASMTFVACGKKESKEAQGENTEQLSRAEQATRAIEAATSMEDIYNVAAEYSDLNDDDFSEEQQARIEKAYQDIQKAANKVAPTYDDEDDDLYDDYDDVYQQAKDEYDKAYKDAEAEYKKAYKAAEAEINAAMEDYDLYY